MRLTDRDVRVILDVYHWSALLRSQAEALYFTSPQRARARLAILTQAGYINRGAYPIAPSITLTQTAEYVIRWAGKVLP